MNKVYRAVATAGGIGYLPLAPGTWAAIVTAIGWYLMKQYFPTIFEGKNELVIIAVIIGIGIWCSGRVEKEWGKDPSKVVIDEVAGMCVALLWIPLSILYFLIALTLFRIFDIAKPFGIKKMEKLGGGWGIMMDDVVAGVYSLLILNCILHLQHLVK